MTLQFPDVSQYTPNVDPSRYSVLIARATLSDRVSDPTYAGFKARSAGKPFVAYHWLNHGNLRNQARWCFQHVGPDVPLMIDAEDVAGNTGYNGPLTVDDILGFAAEYRALGGIVSLAYLPFWYWAGPMGAPHRLGELTAAGIGLVSSNYPKAGYTDNGPGWAVYYPGAPVPVQWQYTSTPIDMNAFRGTVDDFAQLVGMPRVLAESIEVDTMYLSKRTDDTIYLSTGMKSRPLTLQALNDIVYNHKQGTPYTLAVGNNNTGEWESYDGELLIRLGGSDDRDGPVDSASSVSVDVTQDELNAAVASAVTVDELTAALAHLGIKVTLG